MGTEQLTAAQRAARESSRIANGEFGEQHRSQPDVVLASDEDVPLAEAQGASPAKREQLRQQLGGVLGSILADCGAETVTLSEDDGDEFSVYVSEADGSSAVGKALDARVSAAVNAVVDDYDDLSAVPGIEHWEHEGQWTFELS